MQNGLVPHPHLVDINQRDTLAAWNPSSSADHPSQGSNARKINPPNFWLLRPVGVGSAEATGFSGVS